MSQISLLLGASIKEFRDKRNNATAIPCTYLSGTDGMAYLVKDSANQADVSVAIHLSAEVKQVEDGIYDTGYVAINTQDDLFAQFREQPQTIIVNLVHIGGQYKMGYTNRTTAFSVGQTVTGDTSKATGIISEVSPDEVVTSGILYLRSVTGVFEDGEDLYVGVVKYAESDIYDGFLIGVSRSGEFNEITKTWHYTGEVLLSRNYQFVIPEVPPSFAKILTDSTTLWLDLASELSVSIFPSFISAKNVKSPYISVMINSSVALGPVVQLEDLIYKQYKRDSVRLSLVNASANQAQEIAKKIWDAPLKFLTFGINGSWPGWEMITDKTQPSFGIKQNIRTMELDINYSLYTDTTKVLEYILKIAATVNGEVIKTY